MAPTVRLATKRATEIDGKRRRQSVGKHENEDLRAPAVVRIGNWRGGRSLKTLERVKGIEPSYSAWKSGNLVVFSKLILTFSVFLTL